MLFLARSHESQNMRNQGAFNCMSLSLSVQLKDLLKWELSVTDPGVLQLHWWDSALHQNAALKTHSMQIRLQLSVVLSSGGRRKEKENGRKGWRESPNHGKLTSLCCPPAKSLRTHKYCGEEDFSQTRNRTSPKKYKKWSINQFLVSFQLFAFS